jgi:ssDNA-binding Zn-finger/Zn-ribbon topoisomerase 1
VQPQYRYLAKQRLAKATDLLASGDEDNLIYACLELRKCIEALSYELLMGYLSEVPLKALETWQPDKVMKELLRADPNADQTSRIRMRREGADGAPDGDWMDLGEDRRLKTGWATKAYHQLGSFLHVPTIKQSRSDEPLDTEAIRQRVEPIRAQLAHVLGATIWNANFSVSVTVPCTECEAPIKRRSSVLQKHEPVECGNCGQLFDAEPEPDGRYFFVPHSYDWSCKNCDEPRSIVQSKAKPDADVSCPNCGDRATLRVEQNLVLVRDVEKNEPQPATGSLA